MSFPTDCSACVKGNHQDHNASEGTSPGLIGGSYCGCIGDCAERKAALVALLNSLDVPRVGVRKPEGPKHG